MNLLDRWRWTISILLVSGTLGCTTPSSVSITVLSGDRVRVGKQTVSLAELPATLKSMRATSSTEIVIITRNSMGRGSRGAISGRLASAGYRKIMFRGKQQSQAFTDEGR